jgi:hypothetical protein
MDSINRFFRATLLSNLFVTFLTLSGGNSAFGSLQVSVDNTAPTLSLPGFTRFLSSSPLNGEAHENKITPYCLEST